ncbi:MAG: tRNA uridine-5-carboxymethylaminomethyl(34) synthesis enzyme MnmG [Clostridiales bacterium]|nr:tRNA uridine-5-carboxymethylaminomethyl(34) synthesis enzyme MnmG [Clostridiales bacterium]
MKEPIIVIGAGHAGCEAALAAARLGCDTLLLTLNIDSIAHMPCNPSIGGTGKGHLVRELDALGGEMGLAADDCLLQGRMLNTAKGPAVHSLRAQEDKSAYHLRMSKALFSQDHLRIKEAEVSHILTKNGRVSGVRTANGEDITASCVIVATGVYLKSRIIIGEYHQDIGPQGLQSANLLSKSLDELGFELRRFKTGTPARVDARSIDFAKMIVQTGDEPVIPFSFMTDKPLLNKVNCYLTWTNEHTHDIIRQNLHRSPMFSGAIKGTGARYCPSIEDKVHRFADKDRHQLFLEPEGLHSPEWYVQGLSTSLPQDVQWEIYRTVPGLENAQLTRLAYAIEYDCIDPLDISPAMNALKVPGLYFAGQINGTSGYEEAAAQGLLAGVNAAQAVLGREPLILNRAQAYIGVMMDDLTAKGTDEPYRMMTSRAEHRLYLRQDNADLRLTELSYKIGLADENRMRRTELKAKHTKALLNYLQDKGLYQLLKQPGNTIDDLVDEPLPFVASAREQVQISIKYEGYLKKEEKQVKQTIAMESMLLPAKIDYTRVKSLRIEAMQKLSLRQPVSLGQASRIPGVSPADLAVLQIYLKQQKAED